MSTTVNGSSGITFPDSSTQASSQVGMKNRIIDGGFILNQRGYVSGTSLSAGTYAHDRWKAGSGGCTYTFTQGALGVNTTITITSGTLVQVIEGCNLAEGGTYVLSWTGTAQGRLNGGSYGASGSVVITSWTAGTNLNVEFNAGTLGSVQLEKGSTATSFDYRPYQQELALCQRYYEKSYSQSVVPGSSAWEGAAHYKWATSTNAMGSSWNFKSEKRAAPTVTVWDAGGSGGVPVSGTVYKGGYGKAVTENQSSTSQGYISTNDATSASEFAFQWVASSEL